MDFEFYKSRYPDVVAAGIEPAHHYFHTGWREARDPSDWFDTSWYLETYADVRAAGINPFWHFLVQGRHEGRAPRPPGNAERQRLVAVLDRAEAVAFPQSDDAFDPGDPLDVLGRRFALATIGVRGIVVAIGHDDYTRAVGGIQFLTADEQIKFNGDLFAYLHVSPTIQHARMLDADEGPVAVVLRLDGVLLGRTTWGGVIALLREGPAQVARVLVIHTLLGHRAQDIVALADSWLPHHAFFYVHDYASGCEGYQLLRNGHKFCGAPPRWSMACRICVHGPSRDRLLARIAWLFDSVPLHVLAPSRSALTVWQSALPNAAPVSTSVHPHCQLVATGEGQQTDAKTASGAWRAAFVGQPEFHKGWPVFETLVGWARRQPAWALYHFASEGHLPPLHGARSVSAASGAGSPNGMIQALSAHAVDLVLVLSPWPETFCFVAYEALAAGADVICVRASGHVADLIERTGRGLVLEDGPSVLAFFADGRAAAYVRRKRGTRRPALGLVRWGTAATADPFGMASSLDSTVLPTPMTGEADVQVWAAGQLVGGERVGDTFRFALPGGGDGRVLLLSRAGAPAWMHSDATDSRCLGVAISALWLDGEAVPFTDSRLNDGWHGPEGGWIWTTGRAVIDARDAQILAFTVRYFGAYCRSKLRRA